MVKNPYIAILCAGLASCVVLATVALAARAYHPLPFYDYWEVIIPEDAISKLWGLHNQHMMVIPRLLFWADSSWFAGQGLIPLIAIWLANAMLAYCIFVLAPEQPSKVVSLALIVAAFFWARHLENLASSFQIGFIGGALTVVGSFVAFALGQDDKRGWLYFSVFLAALAPTFSMQGLIAPLVLVGMALVFWRWWLALSYLAAFCLMAAVYLKMGLLQTISRGAASESDVLKSVFVAMDTFVDPMLDLVGLRDRYWLKDYAPISVSVGLWMLIVIAAVSYRVIRRREPRQVALLGTIAFGLGCCVLVGIGRSGGDYLGPAFRYATFAVLIWVPTILLLLGNFPRIFNGIAVAAILLILVDTGNARWFPRWISHAKEVATARILADPTDPTAGKGVHPSPPYLVPKIAIMKERKLSIFAP